MIVLLSLLANSAATLFVSNMFGYCLVHSAALELKCWGYVGEREAAATSNEFCFAAKNWRRPGVACMTLN